MFIRTIVYCEIKIYIAEIGITYWGSHAYLDIGILSLQPHQQLVEKTPICFTIKHHLESYFQIKGGGRAAWPNQFQFLCANISYAVGLGNIWR